MTHEIKSYPGPFQDRMTGLKTWEFRSNDRDYTPGDHLHEREYEPGINGILGAYTGRHILSRVMYVFQGGFFGIPEGYCIMSVETIAKGRWLPRAEER